MPASRFIERAGSGRRRPDHGPDRAHIVPILIVVLFVLLALILHAPPVRSQEYDEIGGDDVLILRADDFTGSNPSLGIADNGDLYAAIALWNRSVPDSPFTEIRVYRSQDAGDTWNLWGTLGSLSSPADAPVIHVAEGKESNLYVAFRWYDTTIAHYVIRVAAAPLWGVTAVWTERTALSALNADFQNPSIDSDAVSNTNYHLYLVAIGADGNGGDVWFARSSTFGASWETGYMIASQTQGSNYAQPEVRYGRSGYVHCVFYLNPVLNPGDMAVFRRRAFNYAANFASWDPLDALTTYFNGYDEYHASVAASHVSGDVLISFAVRDASTGTNEAAQVLHSVNDGANWPDPPVSLTEDWFPHLAVAEASARFTAWGSPDHMDNYGAQWTVDGQPELWGPHRSTMDRAYASVPNTPCGGRYYAANPAKGGRLGFVWMTFDPAGQDSLFFDAQWRADPGYPNLEAGFPRALPDGIYAPPALCELDGDPASEIVFGGQSGAIFVVNHDGGALPGWPIDIGDFPLDGTIAVGDVASSPGNEIVAGNTVGIVYAFHPDGTALSGFPINLGTGANVYVSLGAITTQRRQIVAVSGTKVYLINGDGTVAVPFPMTMVSSILAPAAIGDVDGDGDREIVVLQQLALDVLTGDGAVQAFRVFTGGRTFSNAPTLADLDLDGDLEIAAPSDQGDVYLMYPDGTDYPGWPYHDVTNKKVTSVAFANLHGSVEPEVIFNVEGATTPTVHAFWSWGTEMTGFPRYTGSGWYLFGMPVVDDLDWNESDVIVGARDGGGYAWAHDGSEIPGWPRSLTAQCNVSPATGDVDADGRIEVVYTTYSPALLLIFDTGSGIVRNPTTPDDWWPMYGYNPLRQGCLACDADLVSGTEPDAPDPAVRFASPFPNPSAGTVRFAFDLPAPAPVRLDVFDVQGRLVRRLVKAEFAAGPQDAVWDGKDDGGADVGSGVYYARLVMGSAGGPGVLHRSVRIVR